ncbi:hypothetical protein SIO17_14520 [Pseudoalteromonas piscicida]|uniref:SLATT domain-containing protein n=1 Tax=Pseudoalteromonas piscicida TaxID=43662 RepID=A0ABM6NH13_PSEO7|nr:hypothetical protein [Pseudoalteromonas piscicida]ATD08270.1 hypothetical protein PPIS_a3487 [Pseudoalteromonas piscicida]WPU30321.1 hypothetical protein SIO17_14520 [Pseudoalteromonas piscicida]
MTESGDRDKLWESTWNAYYDAYYHEILISILAGRWEFFDIVSKILIALTASGSAIAGWQLWGEEGFKQIWVTIAAVASLLSIVHAALQVQQKLENNTKLAANFTNLRIELETFQEQMAIFPDFDVTNYNKTFLQLKSRLKTYSTNYNPDLLSSKSMQESAQKKLNKRLGVDDE